MVAFTERPLCYQVGILMLLLATAAFAAGLALPWWAQTYSDSNQVIRHSGLWLGCFSATTSGTEKCSAIEAPEWFKAVQGLQCTALVGMLVACAYAMFTNCCLDQVNYSRIIEISSGAGGLLGLISAMVYVAKTSHVLRKDRKISYSWAFGVDVAACVFVTFIAAIIALSNSRHGDDETRFIIEEGGAGHRQRSRSRRTAGGGGGRDLAVERSPVRPRRLCATSSGPGGTEVFVMQNNYATSDSGRPETSGTGTGQSSTVSLGTVCVCQPQQGKTTIPHNCSGSSLREPASCRGHVHCCKIPDCGQLAECSSNRHLSNGHFKDPHAAPPTAAFPAADSVSSAAECNEGSSDVLLPARSSGCCSCSCRAAVQPQPEAGCQKDCGKSENRNLGKNSLYPDIATAPRAVATAPPLEAKAEEHVDFAAAQYFVKSETVSVG